MKNALSSVASFLFGTPHSVQPPLPSPSSESGQTVSDSPYSPDGTLSPQVRENLRKFRSHSHELTCLECGYKGIMGVKSKGGRPFLSAVGALIITMIAALAGWIGVYLSFAIFCVAAVAIYQSTARPILSCPSCNKDLSIR